MTENGKDLSQKRSDIKDETTKNNQEVSLDPKALKNMDSDMIFSAQNDNGLPSKSGRIQENNPKVEDKNTINKTGDSDTIIDESNSELSLGDSKKENLNSEVEVMNSTSVKVLPSHMDEDN